MGKVMKKQKSDTLFSNGTLAFSKAGHDKNNIYVIINEDCEYVYLVDGKYRKLENPKRKRKKHIQPTNYIEENLLDKLRSNKIINNEDVKRAIKRFSVRSEM